MLFMVQNVKSCYCMNSNSSKVVLPLCVNRSNEKSTKRSRPSGQLVLGEPEANFCCWDFISGDKNRFHFASQQVFELQTSPPGLLQKHPLKTFLADAGWVFCCCSWIKLRYFFQWEIGDIVAKLSKTSTEWETKLIFKDPKFALCPRQTCVSRG